MNREKILAYTYKYRGEYFSIKKAIERDEFIDDFVEKVDCLVIGDKDYPAELYCLQNPPFVLFYKGNIGLLKHRKVGVVGSRNPSSYSLQATEALCSCKLKDRVVISGLAKGIDAKAHLSSKNTIGILGCGIDFIYPSSNKILINEMAKTQLILSEYPFQVKPFSWHFPFRNRLIAALSEELYIMEVTLKSGTIITVNEALKLGKEIFVLPFSLLDERGAVNNLLLDEGASFIKHEDLRIH